MKFKEYFFVADCIDNGEEKREFLEITAPNSEWALRGLLDYLEGLCGMNVLRAWEVIHGAKCRKDVETAAKHNFVKPGIVTIFHNFT
jgi:hypothetical protein